MLSGTTMRWIQMLNNLLGRHWHQEAEQKPEDFLSDETLAWIVFSQVLTTDCQLSQHYLPW
jgi:hypothetical protein